MMTEERKKTEGGSVVVSLSKNKLGLSLTLSETEVCIQVQ